MPAKIEGRLKTPEYVANITRHYRQALDTAAAGQPVEMGTRAVEEMELSFSRGFSPGWLEGCDHKRLVPALELGQARRARRSSRRLPRLAGAGRAQRLAQAGRRNRLCRQSLAHEEQGGRVFEIFSRGRSLAERVEPAALPVTPAGTPEPVGPRSPTARSIFPGCIPASSFGRPTSRNSRPLYGARLPAATRNGACRSI